MGPNGVPRLHLIGVICELIREGNFHCIYNILGRDKGTIGDDAATMMIGMDEGTKLSLKFFSYGKRYIHRQKAEENKCL